MVWIEYKSIEFSTESNALTKFVWHNIAKMNISKKMKKKSNANNCSLDSLDNQGAYLDIPKVDTTRAFSNNNKHSNTHNNKQNFCVNNKNISKCFTTFLKFISNICLVMVTEI